MTRKWLEGAAGLRQETVTKSFTKSTGKRADELISGSLITNKKNKGAYHRTLQHGNKRLRYL
jgi:hypothetical protein